MISYPFYPLHYVHIIFSMYSVSKAWLMHRQLLLLVLMCDHTIVKNDKTKQMFVSLDKGGVRL